LYSTLKCGVCLGFRKNPSKDFLGPKNLSKDFFGGELGKTVDCEAISPILRLELVFP